MKYIFIFFIFGGFLSPQLLGLDASQKKRTRTGRNYEPAAKKMCSNVDPIKSRSNFLNRLENFKIHRCPEKTVQYTAAYTMADNIDYPEHNETIILLLEEHGIEVQVAHYEALVNSYLKVSNVEMIIKLLKRYQKNNVTLSFEVYEQIICFFIDHKKLSKAKHILTNILSAKHKPQLYIFEKFFKYFIDKQDVKNIRWIISKIEDYEINDLFFNTRVFSKNIIKNEPNLVLEIVEIAHSYFSKGAIGALCAEITKHHPRKGGSILKFQQNIKIIPNIEMYLNLIDYHIKLKELEKAYTLLNAMNEHKFNIKSNQRVFSIYDKLINAFYDNKNYEESTDLLDEMCYYLITPNNDIYDKIINKLLEQKNLTRAIKIFRAKTLRTRIGHDDSAYKKFFMALLRANYLDAALDIFSEMKLEEIPLHIDLYVALFKAYETTQGGDKKIIALIKEMLDSNIACDMACFKQPYSECSQPFDGMGDDEKWFSEACHAGIIPIQAYTHLAAAYYFNGQPEKGRDLFDRLIKHDIISQHALSMPVLDLHVHKIYSEHTYKEMVDSGRVDPRHPHAVDSGLLYSILFKRLEEDTKTPFPSEIITGRGKGTTRRIVENFLDEHGFCHKENVYDGGVLVGSKKI